MFDAIGRVDRTRLGFTAIPADVQVRVEWHPMFDKAYDVMLHSVDPARYTLSVRPVMRFSTRDVQELRRGEATFVLGVTMTAGSNPYLLLGVVRLPDGSYTETLFASSVGHELGWGPFRNKSGEVTDVSFYALDDSHYRSACRTR